MFHTSYLFTITHYFKKVHIMSKFDFDKITDRRNTGSVKWDESPDALPMWVADMDFPTAPAVSEAIAERAAHPIYGYTDIPDEWYAAYSNWWERRHGIRYEKDELIFCTGVIPAISTAVRKLTTPAEKVVVMTPVYNIFFNSTLNNGRVLVECPLAYDGLNYSIDFERLEMTLADPQVTLLIMCNPHNPVGKIWTKDELAKVGELCRKNGVIVISDEIHCDLTDPGHEYTPFASASDICREISITCLAPTKTFNIAGIQTAAVAVKNRFLYNKMHRALNTDEVAEANVFAVPAAVAAFTKGEEWLNELRAYIAENKRIVCDFIKNEIPDMWVTPSKATYLLWLGCGKIAPSREFADHLRKNAGLFLTAGAVYGGSGDNFLRMNIACPRAVVEEGLRRLKKGAETIRN